MRNELGIRANVAGRIAPGTPAQGGVPYTVTIENAGAPGKGVAAEDVTVSVRVPNGMTILSATGAGYQGVRRDEQAMGDVAVWQIPSLAAAERQMLTLTLSSAPTPANNLRGSITWARPAVTPGPLDTVALFPPGGPGGPGRPGGPGGPPPGGAPPF
jgi:hypothetical protein